MKVFLCPYKSTLGPTLRTLNLQHFTPCFKQTKIAFDYILYYIGSSFKRKVFYWMMLMLIPILG